MRKITVELDVDANQYADIVNAIWMQMMAIGCDFAVVPDGRAVSDELDERWDSYSKVSWKSGGRRGTPQAAAAKTQGSGVPKRG
ncbi:hypothetical protein [Micromonospora chalcea]|uniref:hypothetical protein n=1 Tax=Micromonospora chalcea TaxID=1874 RepID=UPI0037BA76C3